MRRCRRSQNEFRVCESGSFSRAARFGDTIVVELGPIQSQVKSAMDLSAG